MLPAGGLTSPSLLLINDPPPNSHGEPEDHPRHANAPQYSGEKFLVLKYSRWTAKQVTYPNSIGSNRLAPIKESSRDTEKATKAGLCFVLTFAACIQPASSLFATGMAQNREAAHHAAGKGSGELSIAT